MMKRANSQIEVADDISEESTDVKLAVLASLQPSLDYENLLEALLAADGDVVKANLLLGQGGRPEDEDAPARKVSRVQGYQSSLTAFAGGKTAAPNSPRKVTKKGQTLHLYMPDEVAAHTPCSIIHNFLDRSLADDLLKEMLVEAPSYRRDKFVLFENVVESPHTFCFYVDELDDIEKQKSQYVYNGSDVPDVRKSLPFMRQVAKIVQSTVNDEIKKRIKSHYPNGEKLKYQSSDEWMPNTSFVNVYDGGKENVGYHSDELTYLGPRAVIGSISLGVAREFRIR